MKLYKYLLLVLAIALSVYAFSFYGTNQSEKIVKISKEKLKDKIKGGWAGQTIGVTYGGPTEFKYNGTFIQDYQPIEWYDGYLEDTMEEWPDLYDDIYMDLTFVEVLERVGMDAPVDSFANAFANAKYNLWHANQAARYNILHGIDPPESGHWKNNPHADDIDYQIESDYAGLMNPGMPNSASQISDKVGHIMNYGDGWYGGVYMGAMYSLAFTSNDINYVVEEALKTIPEESEFYACITDVIKWHEKYPDDWRRTWFELQKKWSEVIGGPDGVFTPLNIDAKINAAYVVMGLLYGNEDYGKTLEIATRAGQDSDCNPSSAGGILGTMLGFENIPDKWKMGLSDIEDMNFNHTSMSLNDVYDISYRHAVKMIKRSGGTVDGDEINIKLQTPTPVQYEQSFQGMYPIAKKEFRHDDIKEISFEFEGTGFIVRGGAVKHKENAPDHVLNATLYIDEKKIETAEFPADYKLRRLDLFWRYKLKKGNHNIRIVVNNPHPDYSLRSWDYIIYSDEPVNSN